MIRFGYILLLFFPFDLLAQSFTPNPDWRFENFNGQNHFISRGIFDLTIDKHGYIWTSSDGVQRFDGYKTVDFNTFDQAKGGLRSNYTGLVTDKNGKVWISSSGLCYYDDASGKFIYVGSDSKPVITNVSVFAVQENYLWFVCEYGLARLDLRSLKISFTSLKNVVDPLCVRLVDDNTLLIASREKMYIYDIQKNHYSTSTLIYNHSLVKIFALTKSGSSFFLATNLGLFTLKNLKDISLASIETKDIALDDLAFLPGDKEKKFLFLATEGKGVMVYNTISKKIEFTYVHDDNNPYSLPNNIVSKLFTDKQGRLWLCTGVGISMLDVLNQQMKMRFLNKSNTDGLGIIKIARDKYDSTKVWMSSYNQGLICINWKTKKVEKRFNANAEMQRVYDFVQVAKNKWLIVTQKKIMEWDPRSGIIVKNKLPVPDSLALVFNIRKIITVDPNTFYITTNKGLFKYDLHAHQVTATSICPSKNEYILKYDLQSGFYEKGILWIASRNGLFCYNISTGQTTTYRGEGKVSDYFFFDIANAANNQVVCAAGNGITIFNKQTKRFKIINSLANLFNPHCETVMAIGNVVWMGTEVGVLNYDLKTHTSARAEQTPPLQIFPTSTFTVIDDNIVFGFRSGYAYFTGKLKNKETPSDPVIERVYVNNQPVFHEYSDQKKTGELTFNHAENSVNIGFTAFLYTDPDHINFRYKLNGADSKWQYAEDQRNANYAQLSPGDYTFYVQSGNKNGVWNDHLASVNFIIQPPYWETWWFRTLVIVLIAMGLYNLYRYKINHILAIERIREKIASDFHDDIGSALSSISIFSEVADKQLKQQLPPEQTREIIAHISFHSRAMLDAMDDIIWAVNPQNDQFNDLAVRMREFAIPLLEARNIHFDISIQEDMLNTRIKMDARKNIFLIFKECINNIIKHSGCTAMKVAVNKLNNQLEFIISDNGKGFDINAPHTRNGLKNMKKRAAEINGTIQVTSQQGNGTVTRLLVNII